MSKLSYEDKIDIYNKRKNGYTKISLAKQYNVSVSIIDYLFRLINKHGYDVLRTNKNKYYSPYQKEQIINRVLIGGESITSVAIDEGLPSFGTLPTWIKKYKEMGYNIVERRRGRSTMPKITKKKENETDKEEKGFFKRLKEVFVKDKDKLSTTLEKNISEFKIMYKINDEILNKNISNAKNQIKETMYSTNCETFYENNIENENTKGRRI